MLSLSGKVSLFSQLVWFVIFYEPNSKEKLAENNIKVFIYLLKNEIIKISL
jgi:hypothetical protein